MTRDEQEQNTSVLERSIEALTEAAAVSRSAVDVALLREIRAQQLTERATLWRRVPGTRDWIQIRSIGPPYAPPGTCQPTRSTRTIPAGDYGTLVYAPTPSWAPNAEAMEDTLCALVTLAETVAPNDLPNVPPPLSA